MALQHVCITWMSGGPAQREAKQATIASVSRDRRHQARISGPRKSGCVLRRPSVPGWIRKMLRDQYPPSRNFFPAARSWTSWRGFLEVWIKLALLSPSLYCTASVCLKINSLIARHSAPGFRARPAISAISMRPTGIRPIAAESRSILCANRAATVQDFLEAFVSSFVQPPRLEELLSPLFVWIIPLMSFPMSVGNMVGSFDRH